MINKKERIKQKGFSMISAEDISRNNEMVDFSKIRVGVKTLSDATYELGGLKKTNNAFTDKERVLRTIQRLDYSGMRDISNFFYEISGIYKRLCRYMAYMYRYDWMVTPEIYSEKANNEKIKTEFYKVLRFLDNFDAKKFFGEVALKVFKNGCYYGYKIPKADRLAVQELPPKYCRSRFTTEDGKPAVEFNMRFFDDYFRDEAQRIRMLNLFPEEFKKGYRLYKTGKLVKDFPGDESGWYLLDTKYTVKFNVNGEDTPFLIATIPAIIDLDECQDLDRKKMAQQLLKIVIQKMPIDKNGDLVFDVDEAQALHNNAVEMLSRAIGVDVLTTFAEVAVEDMASTAGTTAENEGMDRVKDAVYDQAGVPQLIFNSNTNIALTNSILNDEASIYNLIQQFEKFLNDILEPFNRNPKKYIFNVELLGTTVYNYKELSKIYKEQVQLGYSKLLPQIALGHSQSTILANVYFENEILDLTSVFVPPMSSNTMSADALDKNKDNKDKSSGNNKTEIKVEEKKSGRPEKPDSEKSDKTIANKESL